MEPAMTHALGISQTILILRISFQHKLNKYSRLNFILSDLSQHINCMFIDLSISMIIINEIIKLIVQFKK